MGIQGSKSDHSRTAHIHVQRDHRAIRLYERLCDGDVPLTAKQLVEYFPGFSRPLIARLFNTSPSDQNTRISEDHFHKVLGNILGPRSLASLSQLYFEAFCSSEELQEQDVKLLLTSAFLLFLASNELSQNMTPEDQKALEDVVHTIHSQGSAQMGLDWMETNCPELLMGIHHWFVAQATPNDDVDVGNSKIEHSLPDHEGALLSVGMWWLLSSSLSSIYTQPKTSTQPSSSTAAIQSQASNRQPWTLLYSSREHGLSVNRLQHHVIGYRGPTVLVIACEGDYMYGVALDTEWREGTVPWGGLNCVTIRLAPDYSILEAGENMVLFNSKSRNLPKGLFVGRNPKGRILSLTEGLQTVTHGGMTGSVVNAEVWGCASSDAKLAQAKMKKTELKDAERNAKVKLPGQWDDNPDRMLLEWGTARADYADGYREDRQ